MIPKSKLIEGHSEEEMATYVIQLYMFPTLSNAGGIRSPIAHLYIEKPFVHTCNKNNSITFKLKLVNPSKLFLQISDLAHYYIDTFL